MGALRRHEVQFEDNGDGAIVSWWSEKRLSSMGVKKDPYDDLQRFRDGFAEAMTAGGPAMDGSDGWAVAATRVSR
ncbi:hypothetical protein LR48_Vigan04g186100 [Vigna angularis]|uniref:Uncharacterized protein n=1 Tax=Phaseolus angularis TaxID=3914 RepID=A0A0L9UFZ1_PHAAN|nr:hypothetical protein LR48_Vigan04g186100 [Vigna angularis]